jgi:hypothetical protein
LQSLDGFRHFRNEGHLLFQGRVFGLQLLYIGVPEKVCDFGLKGDLATV